MGTLDRKHFIKLLGLSSLGLLSPGLEAAHFVPDSVVPPPSPASAPLRVAHLTDIHVQSGLEPEKGFAACLHAVNSLVERPDLIINGGDAIMNSALTFSRSAIQKQWDIFQQILKNNSDLPIAHCIGNHDLYGWPLAKCSEIESKHQAMAQYGLKRPYYAFSRGRWKFIVLDSIRCKNTIPGYYARLDEEQMAWLEQELAATAPGEYVCIVSHVPILAICILFDSIFKERQNRNIPDNLLHGDAAELTTLFYRYPAIKACLSGHIHMVDHVNYLGVDYYCNGAVSGSWWKGSHHQFPPSFSVMNFYDDGCVSRELQYYNWNASAGLSLK